MMVPSNTLHRQLQAENVTPAQNSAGIDLSGDKNMADDWIVRMPLASPAISFTCSNNQSNKLI